MNPQPSSPTPVTLPSSGNERLGFRLGLGATVGIAILVMFVVAVFVGGVMAFITDIFFSLFLAWGISVAISLVLKLATMTTGLDLELRSREWGFHVQRWGSFGVALILVFGYYRPL